MRSCDPDQQSPILMSFAAFFCGIVHELGCVGNGVGVLARIVHLVDPAIAVLQGIPRHDESPWVITGRKRDVPLHDLQFYWHRIRKRARLDGVRIHDLRYSYAGGGLLVGEGLPMIGKLLGHNHVHTTARYAHLANDPLKSAAKRIASRIAEIAGQTGGIVTANAQGGLTFDVYHLYFRISISEHRWWPVPDIAIEQSTFERLQRHARPLVDTTGMVLNRALDALELREGHAGPEENPAVVERLIDPRTLPNPTHTKILDASIEGQRVVKPNWNLLLERLLIRAMKQLANFDELRQLCPANIVQGRKEDEGYRHLAEVDVRFKACPRTTRAQRWWRSLRALGIGLEITFMWRLREGAMYPDEKARLCGKSVAS